MQKCYTITPIHKAYRTMLRSPAHLKFLPQRCTLLTQAQPQPEISSKKKGKGQGKRSHPDYRQTTIYIDKVLHRQLLRMLEDSGFDGDFSEWVEQKMKGEIESQKGRDS
ncbi:hypothetical protein PQG02_32275 (plasmid) [Nostoc sp. UHCC 0926]|uniref:hypothetical protein n=1 Tax=Nostoc sp. UHCC 0926 TaxID=3025190 RepID=UPI00235F9AA4|nr:hypothetical protein [Nostoc sp. UHCC 0926]WDD36078.1 hypothetical protein PQG02_32275 [Nostoc sp. UHCC 0926]